MSYLPSVFFVSDFEGTVAQLTEAEYSVGTTGSMAPIKAYVPTPTYLRDRGPVGGRPENPTQAPQPKPPQTLPPSTRQSRLRRSLVDLQLRSEILWRIPSEEIATLVDGCHQLREGDDGSHLGLIAHWYGYTREYSPALLDKTPLRFAERSALGRAAEHIRMSTVSTDANSAMMLPIEFLPPRWRRHVVRRDARGRSKSRGRTTMSVRDEVRELLQGVPDERLDDVRHYLEQLRDTDDAG